MIPRTVLLLVLVATVWGLPPQLQPTADDFESKYNVLQSQVEDSANFMLRNINDESTERFNHLQEAEWQFQTDLTNREKQQNVVNENVRFSNFHKEARDQVESWKDLYPQIKDGQTKRQFTLVARPKTIDLPESKLAEYYQLVADMKRQYNTATVCKDLDCGLKMNPDITEEFRTNRKYDELKKLWLGFRRSTGRNIRPNFEEYVKLSNEGAKNIGYNDQGQMWRVPYDSQNLKGDVEQMYEEVRPLYEQLHAYARRNLRQFYGEANIPKKGPIPAHVFGDMFAEDWSNIYDLLEPYPNQPQLDVSEKMTSFTQEKVYRRADEFYKSLNLPTVPETFWEKSVFISPTDRDVVCQPSTFDFSTGYDFRVKECIEPTMMSLMNAHHELGHVQYYMQYKDQPSVFRDGANPAFSEAVGDAIGLSVATPEYLNEINLLESADINEEQDINFLMQMALRTLPALPYSYALESWRWEVFEGKTKFENMNCKYVDKTFKLQGIKPPNIRSEDDFDAASKQAVPANEEYIRFFASKVLQFQFHKSLCGTASKYIEGDASKPLHRCNLYNSKEAGQKLSDMLKLGSSKPWSEALQGMTGETQMSTSAMREYFKPLEDFLRKDNEANAEYVGWEKDGSYCDKEYTSPVVRSQASCTYVRTVNGLECM